MGALRDVVVIGGSAGSLEPIKMNVRGLPLDFPAAVFVVIHLPPRGRSMIAEVLGCASPLPTSTVQSDQPFEPGNIQVVPPDRHLVVAKEHLHLTRSPKEGMHRPSINVTFRSAAAAYKGRVVGVLLSGMLDDGAAGLWEIARRGGVTIVQDLNEAPFPSMPLSAVEDAPINYHNFAPLRLARCS